MAALEQVAYPVAVWAVTAVLGWLVGRASSGAKRQREESDAIKAGLRSLLRSDIMRTHHSRMRMGCATTVDKEVITRTYQAYSDLGGNSVATRLYEEVMALPTKDCN